MQTAIFPPIEQDSAWKDMLDVYFQEFMLFFYPELAHEINWQAGYEVLDKELQAITTEAMVGKRLVDKLIRVQSRNGAQCLVLIHVEIQGQMEAAFELRLFEYYYRLYDRYRQPILTIAVLTDNNSQWRPQRYQAKVWDAEILTFRFLNLKLLDYRKRKQELETTQNPFGIIILAHLIASEKHRNAENRLQQKFTLTRQLYERGLNRDAILNLYKFIDWVITLPEELEIRYNDSIHKLKQERTMGYITTAERIGMKKGYKEGQCNQLLFLLERKFKHVPEEYRRKLKQANVEMLLLWSERLLDAKTLEEIFV